MPPPPRGYQMQQEPSIWQKAKMGAMMGASVGAAVGAVFGTFNILRFGAGPRGFLYSLGGYIMTSSATFGFFLSIGSVIRTEGRDESLTGHSLLTPGHGSQLGLTPSTLWTIHRRRLAEQKAGRR